MGSNFGKNVTIFVVDNGNLRYIENQNSEPMILNERLSVVKGIQLEPENRFNETTIFPVISALGTYLILKLLSCGACRRVVLKR